MPDTPEVREDFILYYDEIGRFDQCVGKVIAELEKQGASENTMIVLSVTTDVLFWEIRPHFMVVAFVFRRS
jgi:arylsulfatase A-like enzyme